MSIERDVGRILWLGFEGTSPPKELVADIGDGLVGGVIVFKRNLVIADGRVDLLATKELNDQLHEAAPDDEPVLISVDQEGGRVARVREPATVWPAMEAMAPHGAEVARRVGLAMGKELAALGFDIDFAPVLDVNTRPDNPIIGDRAFSDDPQTAAKLGVAFAAGLAEAGVLACGKHFPGHGDTDTDSHLALPRLPHTLERLRSVELVPFAVAARAGLPMVMSAHVLFSAVDDEVPATLSRKVLGDILREELGFRGVVVSDDLDMKAIADHYGVGEAAVRAISAGCDVLLLCRDLEHQQQARAALIARAREDEGFRSRVHEAASRVRGMIRGRKKVPRPILDCIGCAEHQELAAGLIAAER